jgi:thiol-disulfide isomerase/thioredoxin
MPSAVMIAAIFLVMLGQQERSPAQGHPTLLVGSSAPDFSLPGTDGKAHSLGEYAGSPVLAVMFLCNHCPASQAFEDGAKMLADAYRQKGVAFVAIQPNSPLAIPLKELNFTDVEDTLEGMKIRAEHRKFNFPYLYDGDRQEVSQKYGPRATPHLFIFDRERKLRYEGGVLSHSGEPSEQVREIRNALDALLTGAPVSTEHATASGCHIAWRSSNEQVESRQSELKQWEAQPVAVEMATAATLKKLRANPTGKLLLVNFWATWCGPCVSEYPEILKTYLWYRSRGLEFVSVSADVPEAKPAVLKFLRQQHSAVRNLQFASDNFYEMQAAFEPKWQSGVPFTVVITAAGRLVHWQEGEIDVLALRRALLANLPDSAPISRR